MKVVLLCQEEPVFLGPFLRDVIEVRPDGIAAVIVAGRRGAGEKRSSLRALLESLRIFWLVFEPHAFFDALWRQVRFSVLGAQDPNSVEGLARTRNIPVFSIDGKRAADVLSIVQALHPDVVFNQTEILLTREVLETPRIGFVNRHASLLPAHRGRLGSFWAHAAVPPSYGVTIHLVDEGIDTGAVLAQWVASDVDPRWTFPRILRHLNGYAPTLFWKAMDGLAGGEGGTPQPTHGTSPAKRFPTLSEARRYREVLSARRSQP
jgi:folate-dependent phosphoribosylglycinamide formyltransferase PurN